MTEFGKRLKGLRKEKGLSQDALAEKLGLRSGKHTISNWELGNSEPPLSQLRELSNLFEITIANLLSEGDSSAPPAERPGVKCIPTEEYIKLLENSLELERLKRSLEK
jgi:transcriptional regulator with XRE-family HTH domain